MTTEEKVNTARLELQRVPELLNVIDIQVDAGNKGKVYQAIEQARESVVNAVRQLND